MLKILLLRAHDLGKRKKTLGVGMVQELFVEARHFSIGSTMCSLSQNLLNTCYVSIPVLDTLDSTIYLMRLRILFIACDC